MNAYLKNLVAKNMRLAKVIQPRLASRFEPETRQVRLTLGSIHDQVEKEAWTSRAPPSHIEDDAGLNTGPTPAFPVPDRELMGRSTPNEPVMQRISRGESQKIQKPSPSWSNELRRYDIDSDRTTPLLIGTETTKQPDLSGSFQVPRSHHIASSLRVDEKEMRRIESEDRMSREVVTPLLVGDDKAALKAGAQITEGSVLHHGPNGSNSSAPNGKAKVIEGLTGQHQIPNGSISSTPNGKAKTDEAVTFLSANEKERGSSPGQSSKHEISEKVASPQSLKKRAPPGIVVVRPSVKSHMGAESNARGERMAKAEIKPDVQVTIGRIEVRATPATATQQRKRDYPSEMSLDEYLKIKRGGS